MTNMYSPRRERLLTFFRNIFRSLFVFFPGVIFLVLTIVAFWDLSQGEDLMVLATEQTWFFIFLKSTHLPGARELVLRAHRGQCQKEQS